MSLSEKKKQEQTKEEAPTYAQLKYGCYRESYKQEYIKYGFSIEDMAKLRSGWGFKLSDLSIFDIFKKKRPISLAFSIHFGKNAPCPNQRKQPCFSEEKRNCRGSGICGGKEQHP